MKKTLYNSWTKTLITPTVEWLQSMDNIFFDVSKLKYIGKNVIIGKTVRIRFPELVELHDNVIIDDFVFISTGLVMEDHTTIMPNCSITGGPTHTVHIKKYSGIASNCSIMTGSHDLSKSLHLIHRNDFPQNFIRGDVMLEEHTMVGCNSTIMPGVNVGTGARVGAQSFVNRDLEAWTLYAGSPVIKINDVNKDNVIASMKDFYNGN
jgi:acetyltransferase-like isoleucine patch superfamily enzyme